MSLGRALQEERARVEAQEAARRPDKPRRAALTDSLLSALGASRPEPEDIAPAPPEREAPPANGRSWRDGVTPRFSAGPAAKADQTDRSWSEFAPQRPEPATVERDERPDREPFQAGSGLGPKEPAPQVLRTPPRATTRSGALITTTTLAGALIGVAMAFSVPTTFKAVSDVRIGREGSVALSSEAIDSNLRILTSAPVLANVVKEENLTNDPEFNGTGGSNLGGFISFARSLLSRSDGPDEASLEGKAAALLAESISVDRTSEPFVKVGVSTESADKSTLIVNTLVDEYVKQARLLRLQAAGEATDDLISRREELRKSMVAAEGQVETFRAQNDLFDPQGRSIADDELVALSDQLSDARARTRGLDARAKSARQMTAGSVASGGLPEGASAELAELRARYVSASQAFDNASTKLGPKHPQLQALQEELNAARDRIGSELRRFVSSAQVDLKQAVETEQDLAARLAQLKVQRGGVGQDMVKLRDLERDADAKRAAYEAFLATTRDASSGQEAANASNISVIARANPPLEPSGPSRAMIIAAGTLLGLLAGLLLAGLRGALTRLRRADTRATVDPEAAPAEKTVAAQPPIPSPKNPVPEEADMYANYADNPQNVPDQNAGYPPRQPQFQPHPQQGPVPQQFAASHAPMRQAPPMPPQGYGYQQPTHPAYAQPEAPAYWQQPTHPPQPSWSSYAPPQQQWNPPYPLGEQHYPTAQPYPAAQAYPTAPYPPQPPAQPYFPQRPQFAQPQSMGAPVDVSNSIRTSIDEIRATVRECRDAIRQLADKHSRRFF